MKWFFRCFFAYISFSFLSNATARITGQKITARKMWAGASSHALTRFLCRFNKKFEVKLPSTLTHIIMGSCFDQEVNDLPQNLTHLKLGKNFNRSVDNLPQSLIFLELGMFLR